MVEACDCLLVGWVDVVNPVQLWAPGSYLEGDEPDPEEQDQDFADSLNHGASPPAPLKVMDDSGGGSDPQPLASIVVGNSTPRAGGGTGPSEASENPHPRTPEQHQARRSKEFGGSNSLLGYAGTSGGDDKGGAADPWEEPGSIRETSSVSVVSGNSEGSPVTGSSSPRKEPKKNYSNNVRMAGSDPLAQPDSRPPTSDSTILGVRHNRQRQPASPPQPTEVEVEGDGAQGDPSGVNGDNEPSDLPPVNSVVAPMPPPPGKTKGIKFSTAAAAAVATSAPVKSPMKAPRTSFTKGSPKTKPPAPKAGKTAGKPTPPRKSSTEK